MDPSILQLPLTPILGREGEIESISSLLGRHDVRLVTLTGPAGVGKTRLALAVVSRVTAAFEDGSVAVGLATLRDTGLVLSAVAQAVGVGEAANQSLHARLVAALRSRRLLLLLDNFEHVAAAAFDLVQLLRDCSSLKALVTSRTLLRVAGEHAVDVLPLRLPGRDSPIALEQVVQYESVRLFVERARSAKADFQLTESNARAIVEVCIRLDGLPLAIELAAARVRALTPEVLLGRLVHRLPVLVGGPRDQPIRHQTLRDALAWSYELLSPNEQQVFKRLATFEGGCTVSAAEAVCAGNGVTVAGVLDLLTSLVDKSVLQTEAPADGEPRFGMLETIHEYALELLSSSGDESAAGQAHAAYYLALAEAAEPEMQGPRQARWLTRLEAEHDNLQAALRWASANVDREPDLGMRLGGAIWRFWWVRGHFAEGRQWLEQVLASGGIQGAQREFAFAEARAKALNGAGGLAYGQGDYARATALYQESLALRRALRDTRGEAVALHNLGHVAAEQGDTARAQGLDEESLALFRSVGERRLIAITLTNLGDVARLQGDLTKATELVEEGLALSRGLGDTQYVGVALVNLGHVASTSTDWKRAQAFYLEALALYRTLGDGYRLGIAACLEGLAAVASALGGSRRAARLYGAATGVRDSLGAPLSPVARAAHQEGTAVARRALGAEAFNADWEAGRLQSLEESLHEAETLEQPRMPPPLVRPRLPSARLDPLTLREWQVATLVALGFTNRQIASELVISERTTHAHIRKILDKLRVKSRIQVAAWVIERTRSDPSITDSSTESLHVP